MNFFYSTPQFAYLLFLLPLFFILLWNLHKYQSNQVNNYTLPGLFAKLAVLRTSTKEIIATIALFIAWIFATLALMQPMSYGEYVPTGSTGKARVAQGIIQRKAHEIIILIDTSASMMASDVQPDKSRLEAAKEIGDEIIGRLDGQSVALVPFTAEPFILVPPTFDYLFTRLMLRKIQKNEAIPGTDISAGFEEVKKRYFPKPTDMQKTIILLSDGENTVTSSVMLDANFFDALNNRLRVFTIGLGTEKGGQVPDVRYQGKPVTSKLDVGLLKSIAEAGNGIYFDINQQSSMTIAANIIKELRVGEKIKSELIGVKTKSEENLIHQLYFQIPLGFALICLFFWIFYPKTNVVKN